ncbi:MULTISPECIES: kynureninase [unclassified Herbaspirillum]|uniref:kynureninase n=1 Tax=unclassified Herbaspirillum TaxID=2624150 RepID=UPI000E2E526C|nr:MULTISPECIES: kynureninase [unclassified Herbaspirillum]RFB65802.1 kynureninase [Herbaspirillum sp. 3R-3a1]TFI08891.1 kynureninase [Herbaspirillum sp. 3R11]TFI15309.1 kynureninase [Herbaspirillum sp. 3R-11]TFI27854.1 kynureninase [Herbaspirillum sp. 3C11]
MVTRQDCITLDQQDALAACRDKFALPEGEIYLDGNSLGAMPKHLPARMQEVMVKEWGNGLIRSWNDANWIDLPKRVAGQVARLIGAGKDEVMVADSTSVNLYKALVAAVRLNPARKIILSERGNFPTDLYIAQGVAEVFNLEIRYVDSTPEAVLAGLDDSVAVVMLTHVNYRTGQIYPMQEITAKAHAVGALALWDLAHSAGAVEVDLHAAKADMAVGCGYKYLNGGPGAPAFVFVAERHHKDMRQPLSGWHGHVRPFEFVLGYEPAPGIESMQCGTPPLLSMLSLESALEIFDGVEMSALRKKSVALTELFIKLVDEKLSPYQFGLASPRDSAVRGSQVSLTHEQGYAIVQALIARGITGDFRMPNILRFGFTPLYVSFANVYDTVQAIAEIMESGEWNQDKFLTKKAVT